MVEGNSCELNKSDSNHVPIFTPEQYVKILKLLGANSLNDSAEHAVNMESTILSCCTTDWIIDTHSNAHMTGEISLLQNARSLVNYSDSVILPHGEKLHIQLALCV